MYNLDKRANLVFKLSQLLQIFTFNPIQCKYAAQGGAHAQGDRGNVRLQENFKSSKYEKTINGLFI